MYLSVQGGFHRRSGNFRPWNFRLALFLPLWPLNKNSVGRRNFTYCAKINTQFTLTLIICWRKNFACLIFVVEGDWWKFFVVIISDLRYVFGQRYIHELWILANQESHLTTRFPCIFQGQGCVYFCIILREIYFVEFPCILLAIKICPVRFFIAYYIRLNTFTLPALHVRKPLLVSSLLLFTHEPRCCHGDKVVIMMLFLHFVQFTLSVLSSELAQRSAYEFSVSLAAHNGI